MRKTVFYIVLITLAGCKIQQVSIANTEWKLVTINSEDVSGIEPPITLSLDEAQKKISGFAGCNRFFGGYEMNETTLRFSNIGSTKMFCQDKSSTENWYLQTLSEVQSFKTEGEKLLLLNGESVALEFKK